MNPSRACPRLLVGGWCLLLAVLVTAPLLLSRGFALFGDMVFVPRQPWKDQWLAADGSVPRAVPGDAVVSLATHLLPGDLVQKLVLLALLAGGGYGVARLVRARGWLAQCAAASLFVWNPFVYERLAIGHWALLCGYASLPWVVAGAEAVRERAPGGPAALAVPVTVAAWTSPTGGLLAALLAVLVVLTRPRARPLLVTLAVSVTMNLPWVVPGLLSSGGIPADPAGVRAFSATADTPLGTLGSLVTLGGMWKTSVSAPGRDSWFLLTLSLLLVLAALAGLLRPTVRRDPTVPALAAAGLLGLVLAWLPSTATGAEWFGWAAVHVPGAVLLRDSQKWVAPLAVLLCVGLAAAVEHAQRTLARRGARAGSLFLVALTPLAILPGMAWGQFGRLAPVSYPDEWAAVASRMAASGPDQGRTLVLPFESYRRYPWNGERAVLDPASRFFPGEVVVNDALGVGGGVVVAGQDPAARRIGAALAGGPSAVDRILRAEGIGWVLVEKDTPGAGSVPAVGGRVVRDGVHLRLIETGHRPEPRVFAGRAAVLAADVAVGLAGFAFLGAAVVRRARGYTRARGT